jgi:hypothetical protein
MDLGVTLDTDMAHTSQNIKLKSTIQDAPVRIDHVFCVPIA